MITSDWQMLRARDFIRTVWSDSLQKIDRFDDVTETNSVFMSEVGLPINYDWYEFPDQFIDVRLPKFHKERLVIGGRSGPVIYLKPNSNEVFMSSGYFRSGEEALINKNLENFIFALSVLNLPIEAGPGEMIFGINFLNFLERSIDEIGIAEFWRENFYEALSYCGYEIEFTALGFAYPKNFPVGPT